MGWGEMLLNVFAYIFQSFLMTNVGYGIIGIRVKLKELITIVLLNTLNIICIREIYSILNIKTGSRVIIIAIIYTLICRIILKKPIIITIIATLISFSLIIIQELITLFPIIHIFKIDLDRVLNAGNVLSFFVVIASNLLLIIFYIIFSICEYNIVNLDQYKIRK